MNFTFNGIKEGLGKIFFEDRGACYSCGNRLFDGREKRTGLCRGCRDNLEEIHSYRILSESPYMIAYAASFYNDFLRREFADYKFSGASYKEALFADVLLNFVAGHPVLSQVQWISYMPMRRRRELKRAYNPSRQLAGSLAKAQDIFLLDLLEKTKETKEQNKLDARHRKGNVRGSLAVMKQVKATYWQGGKEYVKYADLEDVRMGRGLLLDDLLTTGETMREGLTCLYRAGIYAEGLCLARADYPREEEKERY